MCDVQGMSVTTAETETDCEDCNNYAHAHVFQLFKVAAHIVGFRVVLRVDLASCLQWCSCRCDRPLNLYPKFLRTFTSRKRVF